MLEIILAIALIVFAVIVLKFLKKLVINSLFGGLALLALHFFGEQYGIKLGLTIPNAVISLLLGLAGVAAILILKFFGFTF